MSPLLEVQIDGQPIGVIERAACNDWWAWTPFANAPEAARTLKRQWASRSALRVALVGVAGGDVSRLAEAPA